MPVLGQAGVIHWSDVPVWECEVQALPASCTTVPLQDPLLLKPSDLQRLHSFDRRTKEVENIILGERAVAAATGVVDEALCPLIAPIADAAHP